LQHFASSHQDALSGDPWRAAGASFMAGIVQATVLLPINTVQTQVQTKGHGVFVTLRSNFEGGTLRGIRNLYGALGPTYVMLGARQALKFGGGAAVKQRLPAHWPEMARDIFAGSISAMTSTTLLFPLDTLKTRWQTGQPSPKNPREMYRGFAPAVSYSAFGMALWVVSRNALERTIPDYEGPMQHWKHFVCGGIAGLCVQLPTFPFDTLKKRLQSAQVARGVLGEVRELLREGGPMRFYSGFWVKCGFVALNGAVFNTVFVACRKLLRGGYDIT